MSKLKAGEVAVWVTERAIQILGGNGYTREFPVERWHRDAKIYDIFEGTAEIQQLVIARAISGDAHQVARPRAAQRATRAGCAAVRARYRAWPAPQSGSSATAGGDACASNPCSRTRQRRRRRSTGPRASGRAASRSARPCAGSRSCERSPRRRVERRRRVARRSRSALGRMD